MNKIKVKFGFISIFFIITILLTGNKYTPLALLAVAIHEGGHLVASKLFRIELSEFSFGILGARLKTSTTLTSYWQEILLCLFGPLFNYLTVVFLYIFRAESDQSSFLILASLILGTLNLLPIKSFDGGRIFKSLLCLFLSPLTVSKILNVISFIFVFTLWVISIYFLLIYTSSLGLFVFSLSLFCSIFVTKTYD